MQVTCWIAAGNLQYPGAQIPRPIFRCQVTQYRVWEDPRRSQTPGRNNVFTAGVLLVPKKNHHIDFPTTKKNLGNPKSIPMLFEGCHFKQDGKDKRCYQTTNSPWFFSTAKLRTTWTLPDFSKVPTVLGMTFHYREDLRVIQKY